MNLTLTRASQLSQLIRRGGNILVAILLAKTYLPPSDIGIYETLTFLCSIADFFWLNALLQAGLSYFPTLSETEKPKFIFQQFLIFNLFSIALFCVFILLKSKLLLVLTGQSELPFYEIYWYFLLFHFPSFLIESNYLLQKNAKALLVYSMIAFGLQQILFFYPILTHSDFKYSFYGLMLFGILKYIWLIINVLKNISFELGMKELRKQTFLFWQKRENQTFASLIPSFPSFLIQKYLIVALPLMGYAALNGLAMNFDGILINWFYEGDKTIFALYRYGARELPISLALSIGLSNALVPLIATNCAEGFYALKQKSKRLWHALFPLSIALLVTSHYWYPKIFRAEFAQSAAIFDIYLLLIISRLLFSNTILIALNETQILLKISIIETILNLVLSIIGIYCFGFMGVAGATVIAYWFEKVAIVIYLKQKHNIGFNDYGDKKWYIGYVSLLLITYFLKYSSL
jgi:Polysaccharide biosynthesis C-terminal domain